MKDLLNRLLNKRGISDASKLNEDEKAIFDNWNKILSKEELTLEDFKTFCQMQIDIIEGKWRDLNTENTKKAEWIPYHTVYKTLLTAISSPQIAREALERQLNEMLK